MTKFQKWARDNYKVGDPIDDMQHPDIQAECKVMNDEAAAEKERKRATIKETVESVDALSEEFKGNIVIYATFKGSISPERKLTKTEQEQLLAGLTPEQRTIALRDMKAGNKRLFSIDGFKELQDITSEKSRWLRRVRDMGIPYIGDSMTVVPISAIPEVDDLLKQVVKERDDLIAKLEVAWPKAISPEVVKSAIYDPKDYRNVEAIKKLYRLSSKWMHFGVPDILKEINKAMWEAERVRAVEVWKEVKAKGTLLLRKQLAEVTERLVEAVQPDADGNRKRFYGTAVTNLTDFFATFDQRNAMTDDDELAAQVAKLRKLVEGREVDEFKSDEVLRKKVVSAGDQIKKSLLSMVTEAEDRMIRFED